MSAKIPAQSIYLLNAKANGSGRRDGERGMEIVELGRASGARLQCLVHPCHREGQALCFLSQDEKESCLSQGVGGL